MIARRRHVPFSLVAVVALLVMACQPAAQGPGGAASGAPGSQPGGAKQRIEVFSWWTTGGEAAGLDKLIAKFNSENPQWEVFNAAVAGGAGSNAKAVLKTRMLGGDPPDSFQVHMGRELIDTWVTTGYMEPLNDLYNSEGWTDKFPKDVLAIVSADNSYWSVPVNIHRANVLWYNKKVFSDAGVQAPKTFEEFKQVADTLKAKGVTPLALGDSDKWAATHLFETILLGTLGADGYKGLWTGQTDWAGPQVTQALETLKTQLQYVNSDHNALTWDQANQLVIDGKAAMTVMGDWADGDYIAKKFTDYGWAPTPGTEGIYLALSDSFGLPKNAKNAEGVKAFLKLLGSAAAQDLFNPLKGSIPARTDAGTPPAGEKQYDEYLKSAMNDWKSNTIAPSLAHGAAASEGWLAEITDAISAFVTNQDVAATQAQLATACKTATVCK
jgi:glucose/mannose transport system substrate-binding protein